MLRVAGTLQTPKVAESLLAVPRHLFVDRYYDLTGKKPRLVHISPAKPTEHQLKILYGNTALVSHRNRYGTTSSISAPTLVVQMLEQLRLRRGMKVLEIGAGTGWNAALIGHIVGAEGCVTSIDIQADVTRRARNHIRKSAVKNVHIITADGMRGCQQHAPYDRIVTTVNSPDVSPYWMEQLKSRGVLLISIQEAVGEGHGLLIRLRKRKDHLRGEVVGLSGFLIMDGEFGQEFVPRTEKIAKLSRGRKPRKKSPMWPQAMRTGEIRDFLFFAQLEGMCLEPGGAFRLGTAILRKPATDSICVVESDRVDVYGGDESWFDLIQKYQKWVNIGAPTRLSYSVEVWPRVKRKRRTKSGWLVRRENSTLIFRLKKTLTDSTDGAASEAARFECDTASLGNCG